MKVVIGAMRWTVQAETVPGLASFQRLGARSCLVGSKRQSTTVATPADLSAFRADGRPLLDMRAAAERLGCSERFVRRLVQERRIPFVKLGGTRVRFLASDLDRWVLTQRVDAHR